MLTESHVGSQNRARASLTIVRPNAYPKTTAHYAFAAAENETGARHVSMPFRYRATWTCTSG
jgi:hypothetical protein